MSDDNPTKHPSASGHQQTRRTHQWDDATKQEAECAFTALRQQWAKAATEEPDLRTEREKELLRQLHQTVEALKREGWKDIDTCPKDGTVFLAIEAQSTGVHRANYWGQWPSGGWHIFDAGDTWPGRPILWKPDNGRK